MSYASLQALCSTSTPILYTPTICSTSGSDVTGLTWEGWTDEALVSPFQKKSSNPFFVDDLAPDACTEDLSRDAALSKNAKRPPPFCRHVVELPNSMPVSPNTAHSQYKRLSFLTPVAPVYKPAYSAFVEQSSRAPSKLKRFSILSSAATNTIELLQKQ
ncbi:uncharacterized protein M421DRAFT_5756 [Didymella exigua CBS 183.55]|uniref:Uncharacterized protein n=1 Tax=Didymella exigua CBS 183.55 TaxID=1150837 RepID=A0A6A5RLI1_9PLEO|nr:uncharacterized protein M421DRAFT_5756 [Didymella exigua CBS 183.55]KAF1928110.1 hypothetical protein M421DRAFT_5756 [Didymella exigua CBS 183.55]